MSMKIPPKKIPPDMYQHVHSLIGSQLQEIDVKLSCVDFIFFGDFLFTLRIKKNFNFSLKETGRILSYGFDSGGNDSEFIHFNGLKCANASISENGMEVALYGGSTIKVPYEGADFEPLEFIGATGKAYRELAFYYVL